MNEDDVKIKKLTHLIKIFCIGWFVNLIYFTSSLWAFFYFQSIGHWAANPLEVMMISGGIIKAVLSFAILICLQARYDK